MLEARELRKTYTTDYGLRDAVRTASFTLESGEFVAIVGPSGSGKSTLLAMLGGLCRPTAGSVTLDGVDLWALPETRRAAFRNHEVGFVFQFASLLSTLRVIDNVALPALMHNAIANDDAYRRASAVLARVGLADRANAYPSELSGGEQRRAALARAIVNAPPILLADEPISDLDEDAETEVLDSILEIHRRDGVALVVVTHDPRIARRSDRILEVRNGSTVATRAGSSRLFEAPAPPAPLVQEQHPEPSIRPAALTEPAPAVSPGLGAGLGAWLLSVCAWVIPAIFVALALNQGVALYQRQLLNHRRQVKAALEDAALLWLRAEIQDLAYGPGSSYTLTLALENLSTGKPVFAMTPTVRAYVQAGFTWQEVPARSLDGQEGRVMRIDARSTCHFAFEPNVKEYTEQLAGYMHVRLTTSTLVSQRSVPGDDLVERVDDYYIHLKPHGADDAAILRKVRFPGKPPPWIPMPPH
jgi:putative ABC transport system ATP-binding protein/macrolide transport system ATP-binding/permease protein/lipoprotein-releasing system ATP-binding protein